MAQKRVENSEVCCFPTPLNAKCASMCATYVCARARACVPRVCVRAHAMGVRARGYGGYGTEPCTERARRSS